MGHDFGEVQTDRDRRERGDEVIVTVREYRECTRCGETRVISENKEVRHASPASPDADEEPPESEAPGVGGDTVSGTDVEEDVTAEEDDGVILEDEPEERDPGAWPESESEEPEEEAGEPAPWPDVEGEDEGFDAEPGDGGPAEGVEFSSGLTPEASASDAGTDASADDEGDVVESTGSSGSSGSGRSSGSSGSTGFRRASAGPNPGGRQHISDADAEYYCPECEFSVPVQESSNRPGDICPNCRLGYLTEREA